MCAGTYHTWKYPRHLSMINGETLIERTIRLLEKCGVDNKDITITASKQLRDILTDQSYFEKPPASITVEHNTYDTYAYNNFNGYWTDCFSNRLEEATYLCGDVVFSPDAIKKIVETKTDDIEFFASAPPFDKRYCKEWAEPFAFKVVDYWHLRSARFLFEKLSDQKVFKRKPIAWEFWQVVKGTKLNIIDYTNYTVINDYTCDIDEPGDIYKFEGGSEWIANLADTKED